MTTCHRFGRFELRPAERLLLAGGEPAKLGARAFDLLLALLHRRDRVVCKNELLDLVWPGLVVEENNLQVHISTLRKLLGPSVIATIPGRGYRFTQTLAAEDGDPGDADEGRDAKAPGPAGAPALSTQLIGRDDDLDALRALVLAHPLVTVTGAGGIGKTTLARALARRCEPDFADGIALVELAPVSDPAMVATAVANALEVKVGGHAPLDAIVQAIGAKRLLVVLDNCEHLLGPAAQIIDALQAGAPGLRWLATSQEPLKLAGEQVFRLGALSLPDGETVAAARASGAVALFETRARAADPRFGLTPENVGAAIEVCRRLDGIALAIELAAARVPLLGLDGLRRRLDERLRLLSGGTRLALPRHQNLRAALEWSHSLLTPSQQAVFRRLGVFAGSFSLDAAQSVASDGSIGEWDVLDEMAALADKSLLVVGPDAGGEPRYRLLETMRHFALERLAQAGETAAVRTRHLDVFVALSGRARADAYGPRQGDWNERLHLEHENFLAAHAWCAEVEDSGERDLRLFAGLHRYWINRALLAVGFKVGLEALQRPGAGRRDRLRSEVLTQTGRLAGRVGLFEQGQALHDEAVAIAREQGSPRELADALTWYGMLRMEQGDTTRARQLLEEALALALQVGPESHEYGSVSTSLGELERLENRLEPAYDYYKKGLAQCRAEGDLRGIVANAHNLGMTAILLNRGDEALQWLRDSIAEDRNLTIGYGSMFRVLLGAGVSASRGGWELAARLEAVAIKQMERLGWPLDPADQSFADTLNARIRGALGDAAYEAAAAAGRAMSLEVVEGEFRDLLAAPA